MGRKRIRIISMILLIACVFLTGGAIFFDFYSGHNYGIEFGYYRRFNRFQHAIQEMPNVEIVDVFLHKDVTLEDFEFNLLVDDEFKVSVWIGETNPIRDEHNIEKIREYISEQIVDKIKSPNYENQWRLNK